MLDRAKRLSSTQDFLLQECKNLKGIFLKFNYPEELIDSAINHLQHPTDPVQTPSGSPVRITLPFNPLTPGAFCEKGVSWTFWWFLGWISVKLL